MKNNSMELETVKEESSTASSENLEHLQPQKQFDEKNLYYQELNNRNKNLNTDPISESILMKPSKLADKDLQDELRDHPRRNSSEIRIGNTLYTGTTPLTVVNHIRTSLDDGEIEITVYDNGRRTSVASSATFSGKHIWYGVTLFTLIVMTSIIATMMITLKPQNTDNVIPDDDDPDDFDIQEKWYVKKSSWMENTEEKNETTERPIKYPDHRYKIKHPAKKVILDETSTESCQNVTDCTKLLRQMQDSSINARYKRDIDYNFLVSQTGLVFEGRGANISPHYYWPIDRKTLLIGCIGTFNTTQKPTDIMTQAISKLLKNLIKQRKVTPIYDLIGDNRLYVQKPIKIILSKLLHLLVKDRKRPVYR